MTGAIPHRPGSASDVLRATHILLLEVETSAPGPWREDSARFSRRDVAVELRVERALKGAPDAARVALVLPQYERRMRRIYALYGVWSKVSLEAGSRLVAFCDSSASDLGTLLGEACFRVEAAEEVLPDLERIERAGDPPRPVAELLAAEEAQVAAFGVLFIRYLSARGEELCRGDFASFDRLVALTGQPALPPRSRAVLFHGLFSMLSLHGPCPERYASRLLQGVLDAFESLPVDAGDREHVLAVFLPNLLGLEGSGAPRRAAALLGAPDRARLRRLVQGVAGAEGIERWLDEETR